MRNTLGLSPWSFKNLNSYNKKKRFPAQLTNTSERSSHWNIYQWANGRKLDWWGERNVEMIHIPRPTALKGEESGCTSHCIHPGGAERFSEHSSRNGKYELQLSPMTRSRDADRLSGGCHSRQKNRATDSVCFLNSHRSLLFNRSVRLWSIFYLKTWELTQQDTFPPS